LYQLKTKKNHSHVQKLQSIAESVQDLVNSPQAAKRGLVRGESTAETTQHATAVRKNGAEGINYANSSTIKRNSFDGGVVGIIQRRLAVAWLCRPAHVPVCPGKSSRRTLRRINQNAAVRTCMSTSNSSPVDVSTDAATCPIVAARRVPCDRRARTGNGDERPQMLVTFDLSPIDSH